MKLRLLCLPILLLVSCSSHNGIAAVSAPVTGSAKIKTTRQIQKSGSMTMTSRSLKESSEKSVALVQSYRGMLSSSSLTKNHYAATIQVPSPSLEELMESLTGAGKVTHKQVRTSDVTERYHDLQAVLKNKRALRDRLRKLLDQATKVKDILKIEEQLTRIQTELDQMETRMKTMQSRVAYSTLNFSIERERTPGPIGAVTKSVGWIFGKMMSLN